MNKWLLCVILCLINSNSGFAIVTWRSLWNGISEPSKGAEKFPGFYLMGTPDDWTEKDSSIYYEGNTLLTETLWYKQVFTEGTFEVTYKITQGNGGVFIIGRPGSTTEEDVDSAGTDFQKGTSDFIGVEVDVGDQHAGCIYCGQCGGWQVHTENESALESLTDTTGWVDLRMSAKGRVFRSWVKQHNTTNWMQGTEYTHDSTFKGRFGFEAHSGAAIWYKNIKIAEGCNDTGSQYYDKEVVENWGWVLKDNGSCNVNNWGCKDSTFNEYNPDALFEDSSLCQNTSVIKPEYTFNYNLENQSVFKLTLSAIGKYQISIINIKGVSISAEGEGKGDHQFHLPSGVYILTIKSVGQTRLMRRLFVH
ncbi:MAG: DUF1080 domain-containing protein [Fibrobacteria bacterium]|nr:DUF1080 domain-containing protein [Fibrobacteria bacterium]